MGRLPTIWYVDARWTRRRLMSAGHVCRALFPCCTLEADAHACRRPALAWATSRLARVAPLRLIRAERLSAERLRLCGRLGTHRTLRYCCRRVRALASF